jgi:hypothetical protein
MRCLYSGENWRRLAFAGISGSAARPPAPPRAGEKHRDHTGTGN